MNIEVKRNDITKGYYADFEMNGCKYRADVSDYCLDVPECAIFAYKNGKIDWSGVYCNRDVTVSKKSLLDCIKEFMEEYDETDY